MKRTVSWSYEGVSMMYKQLRLGRNEGVWKVPSELRYIAPQNVSESEKEITLIYNLIYWVAKACNFNDNEIEIFSDCFFVFFFFLFNFYFFFNIFPNKI